MTVKKDLKRIIRTRMAQTGEGYTSARAQVLRDQEGILAAGLSSSTPLFEVPSAPSPRELAGDARRGAEGALDAIVLKLNRQSARVRIVATGEQVTVRSSGCMLYVPGQIVAFIPEKRWTHRGNAYGTGKVGDGRIDIPALGLEPLGLEEQGLVNCREEYGESPESGPLRALWQRVLAKPRLSFEMEQVIPGVDYEDPAFDFDVDPIIEASELNEAGAFSEAQAILMDLLVQDLRCIDAHAHLGNFTIERWPAEALLHYEVGLRIGEQALGPGFSGLLPWGYIDNRPFLRCLHGYGIALWRLGQMGAAERVFERMIWLNPNDNQGARFCLHDVREGRSWEETAPPATDTLRV